jgi:hypothetical protein
MPVTTPDEGPSFGTPMNVAGTAPSKLHRRTQQSTLRSVEFNADYVNCSIGD